MILHINNRIKMVGGRVLYKESNKDIILSFKVLGSYFPPRSAVTSSGVFELVGQTNVSNIVYFDFNDGTGEHAYPFKASGGNRRFRFDIKGTDTNPSTFYEAGTYNYAPYFYDDLPPGVKNTVNETYGSLRTVTVRFEKPQAVSAFSVNRIAMYDQFPGAVSKLQNLVTLFINSVNNITSFPQDFYYSQIKNLTLNFIGSALNDGIPLWILNSPIENLSLSSSIDLSNSPVTKRVSQLNMMKHSLKELLIAGAQINYTLPNELGELYKLTVLELDNNQSPSLRLPSNLSGFVALSDIGLSRTAMPIEEYERIIQSIPSLRTVNMKNLSKSSDFTFTETNNYITTIRLGSSTWGGSVPSFVNQLLALQQLDLTQVSGNLQNTGVSGWGNFSNCTQLTTINISRVTTITTTIPSWFSSLTKLKTFLAAAAFNSLIKVDQFVDSIYSFVITNSPITGTSISEFRNMTVDIYGSSSVDIPNSFRPSGTFQQPSGYVQGVSNGSPASQMEKIWILTAQYAHIWLVKP